MTELIEWLVKQTPVIVVMGVVIVYLYKEVKHLQHEIVREDTLDEERNVALQSKLDDKNKSEMKTLANSIRYDCKTTTS